MPHSSTAVSKVDDVPELVTETLALCAPPVTLLPERQSQPPSRLNSIPVPNSIPTLSHSDKHISPDIATSSTPHSKPTQPPQVTFAQSLSQVIQTISNQQPTSTLVQPPSNLFGITKAKVHRPLPKNSKLKVHIHATFADGTTKQLQALVDTCAEVSLINPIFGRSCLLLTKSQTCQTGSRQLPSPPRRTTTCIHGTHL